MALPITNPKVARDELAAKVAGRIIGPEDPDYDEARTVVMGGIDRRPALIVRPANAQDVAMAIALARESGLELAVRGGGHSAAGHGVSEGGIVIDLRGMKEIEIDAEQRLAWAGGGLTAGEYSIAAAAHGLATGFGDTGSVGIGGITLGGGIGYLVRRHGLTIDSLVAAEIVTADGELLRVDAESHPDLFWAIRGGGGNFGVVTRFQFRLHPLPAFVGGILVLPATADVIAGFMAAADAAPEELSTIANVMNCPPMPFVPEELHGSLVVMAMMGWSGDLEAGQRAMAPFRALAEPIADMVRPMSYPEMFPPEEGGGYRPLAVAKTMFLRGVDRGRAETIMQYLEASDAPMRAVQLRVLGGAMARVPSEATAFAHRASRVMAVVVSLYIGPDDRAQREAWVDDLLAALDDGEAGAYVNFVGDEGPDRVRAAYPGATYERLAAIKRTYDPTNLFRLNQNVPPAG
ncbi:MAG TPA: FAD-binding oxidoreductase [Candidatus Limnocylindria bacterium]|nr:FAD-binding oxidoreductase [Candidatus Limnocylindria bacterium]